MKKIIFILSYIILSTSIFSQVQVNDQIIVIGSATIEVPADIITIKINLSFQDRTDGKAAFGQHKDAEEKLIKFLKEENIPDSLIRYSLLNISSTYDYSRGENPKIFNTNQTITIKVYNFSEYVSFQLKLIENGFTSYNQMFESTKSSLAMNEAIQKAVYQAKHKAELIAIASGRKIKKISKISDTEETEPIISRYSDSMFRADYMTVSTTSLTDIPQTIKIEKQVKVIFDLE